MAQVLQCIGLRAEFGSLRPKVELESPELIQPGRGSVTDSASGGKQWKKTTFDLRVHVLPHMCMCTHVNTRSDTYGRLTQPCTASYF